MVFDVGETLVDETREYGTWADWLGVPRHTFAATFGAVIAQGLDYREVFQRFRPGFDLTAERAARTAAGFPEWFGEEDLYADTRPCLKALRDQRLWLGVVGNQTVNAGVILRGLDLGVDLLALAAKFEPGVLTPPEVNAEDVSGYAYTGGTTGRPKGVMSTYRSGVTLPTVQLAEWDWPDEVRFLVATPLSHAGMSAFIPTLLRGGSIVVLPH
ncbi:AMP-binding protein, partial [Nocardia grenadensis]